MQSEPGLASSPLPLSARSRRTKEQPISFLIGLALHKPHVINLAAGLVDPRTLPVQACDAITRRIFANPERGRAALQYDTTLGLAELRHEALAHIERMEGKSAAGLGLSADRILITTGSQQALYLIGDALIDPGDIVIAADPSYFVYTAALSSFGAKVLTVPMDDDGMDVEAVAALLDRLEQENQLSRVKFIYCTSYYHNPTGLTLSLERRKRLFEIARSFGDRHRILILEDAAYRELRYDGPALPSIKSFDAEDRWTVLSHTFSKPFAPGLKLGYTAMPPDLLEAVLQEKGNHDFGSSSLAQHIALECLRDGSYLRHGQTLRESYRLKRDAVLAALARFMPPGVSWTRPHGGLYVWVTLPKGADTSRGGAMFPACVARDVLYVPGDYCFQGGSDGPPTNHMRLSFGQVAAEQIEAGIERLGVAVRQELGRLPHAATHAAPDHQPAEGAIP